MSYILYVCVGTKECALEVVSKASKTKTNKPKGSKPKPFVLVDGNFTPPGLAGVDSQCVVGGDGLEYCIAAASIIAKVTRDRLMVREEERGNIATAQDCALWGCDRMVVLGCRGVGVFWCLGNGEGEHSAMKSVPCNNVQPIRNFARSAGGEQLGYTPGGGRSISQCW